MGNIFSNLPSAAGLYLGKPETLTPSSVNIESAKQNQLSLAVRHVNEARLAGHYTLLLNASVRITKPSVLNCSGSGLTIIGIGKETSVIEFNRPDDCLFDVENNVSLTIGPKITLQSISDSQTNMIRVSGAKASLTMLPGSKITGHRTKVFDGAVNIREGASFTMKGGEICENTSMAGNSAAVGGVYLATGTKFTMEGESKVFNNTAAYALASSAPRDIYVACKYGASAEFNLFNTSNIKIDRLVLVLHNSLNSIVTLNAPFNGNIKGIELQLDAAFGTNIHAKWEGREILKSSGYNISSTDALKFDNALEIFSLTGGIGGSPSIIRSTHSLVLKGSGAEAAGVLQVNGSK